MKNGWLLTLKFVYVLAFVSLFVMVATTAYALSHPELGLLETNPLVRAYMAEYGPVVALLIAILVNSSVLIFSGLFLTFYRLFQRRYNWHHPLTDAIAYSLVATFGLYALTSWSLNAANDVYVLLFHSDAHLLAATLELWTGVTGYLMLGMFLFLFVVLYVRKCGHLEHMCRCQ